MPLPWHEQPTPTTTMQMPHDERLTENLVGMSLEQMDMAKRKLDDAIMSQSFCTLPFERRASMRRARLGLDYLTSAARMCRTLKFESLMSTHDEPW